MLSSLSGKKVMIQATIFVLFDGLDVDEKSIVDKAWLEMEGSDDKSSEISSGRDMV